MLSDETLRGFAKLSAIDSTSTESEMGEAIGALIAELRQLRKIKDAAKEFYESDFVMVEEHWERDGRTKIIIPIEEEKLKAALAEYEGLTINDK